jgi:hypothetical protein
LSSSKKKGQNPAKDHMQQNVIVMTMETVLEFWGKHSCDGKE